MEAISEESTVKTVTLYMKDSNQSDYKSYNLTRRSAGENRFERILSNVDLLNKKSFRII